MAAATAYCTSNTTFHQHSLTTTRSQFTPVPRRTTSSPSTSTSFSSTTSITHIDQPSIIKTIKSDENNNDHQIDDTTISNIDEVLYITSDDDDDDDDDIDNVDDNDEIVDDIEQEQFLALVGLRSKIKKPIVPNLTIPSLTKRWACPVCLLPIPKYIERVRQALNIRLPSLKSLSITCDIESFCSTDDNARAQSLLPRSVGRTRALSRLNKSPKKRKSRKTEFISMAVSTFRNNTNRTSMSKCGQSILRCHVLIDRLEQSTIDQIMENSTEDNDKIIETTPTSDRSSRKTSPKASCSLSISQDETTKTQTSITTVTTDKNTVKRKTTATEIGKPKRFKSVNNDSAIINNNDDDDPKNDLPSSTYERIYLKCFVCSKRQYIDAPATNSAVLHSHWLEHDGDLSLNIYDSEIDSILTRVVEFFNFPKQHMLEGKIKTVFICNSKEIRCTSATNLPSNDSYIVID